LELKTIKAKKEKYLDSLIDGNFSKGERERINQKIDDFSLEEKQIQASIYQQEFQLNAEKEKLITIEPFKQSIVSLKINHENMTDKEWFGWLNKNIEKIYIKEGIEIRFKALKIGS